MDITALGSFSVTENGVDITPRASKPRTLLALLSSNDGLVMPIHDIIDELWEEDPPRSAMNTTQTYVMQLRQLIEHATRRPQGHQPRLDPKQILKREPIGYWLDCADGASDISEYERFKAAGYRALAAGDLERAREQLAHAEGIWCGRRAFEGVRTGPRLRSYAVSLRESYNIILEHRIEIDLQLGRHHLALAELAGLVVEYPANERLRADYVIALYRSGQRTRALAECDQLRSHLIAEFGLEPSATINSLRQAILLEDEQIRTPDRRFSIHDYISSS